jgi:translation initiation factor IF-3
MTLTKAKRLKAQIELTGREAVLVEVGEKVQVSLSMPVGMRAKIDEAAKSEGVSRADIMRRIIRQWQDLKGKR